MKRISTCVLLIFVVFPISVLGVERVGTTSFQFLKIPVGVRGIGIGNAFVAGANDASSIYWNPAGLGWANKTEVMLTHLNLPADINYDNVAIALPFSQSIGTFGLNLGVLHMDDIAVRTAERPEGTGQFVTASDFVLGLSYSRLISDFFTFGVTVKYVREELADFVSSNFSFDAGLQYQTNLRSVRLGMVIQNFGPDVKFDGTFLDLRTSAGTTGSAEERGFEDAPMPISFQAGIIADMETMFGVNLGESIQGNVAIQFIRPSDNSERVNGGAELSFSERFAVRGGYNFNHDTDSFTLGFGVLVPLSEGNLLRVDYAYADQGDITDTSTLLNQPHRFSLSFQF